MNHPCDMETSSDLNGPLFPSAASLWLNYKAAVRNYNPIAAHHGRQMIQWFADYCASSVIQETAKGMLRHLNQGAK